MKIAAATLSMQSQHAAVQRQETRESLRMWVGSERPDFEGRNRTHGHQGHDQVRLSDSARARHSSESRAIDDAIEAADNDPMLTIIRRMVELLTGKPVQVYRPDTTLAEATAATPEGAPTPEAATTNPRAGYGIEYDYHSIREEAETTSFSAQGVVRTADGKEIAFKLDLDMSRYYREEVDNSFRAGDAVRKDPLVINFNGNAAQLTDQRFLFDLNADGSKEELAMLGAGSGYLALDLNGNGTIDSGAELFGPATGSGFAELAAYDQDSNGWIDESDAAYSKLRVWTPAADNAGSLDSLHARNVGALFLGQVATPFELRGAQNSDLGAIAATGLYLTESGTAGTLQEIDLSV